MTFSTTLAERNATRETIRSMEDRRDPTKFNYELLTPIVRPIYAEIWNEALANKMSCTIQVQYTEDNHDEFIAFLRGWILANGYNRESKDKHVTEIIGYVRSGFSPASTQFAVDVDGYVRNGGHSGKAILRAFFPPTAYYGLRGKPYMVEDAVVSWKDFSAEQTEAEDSRKAQYEAEGLEYEPFDWTYNGYYFEGKNGETMISLLPALGEVSPVGEYDEDGEYVPDTDSPELRQQFVNKEGKTVKFDLIINVAVFGPSDALHRENTTLVPDVDTYLSMVGPIKTHIEESVPSWIADKIGNVLTMVRKRTMHSASGEGFGTVGRGGRMNGEDAPSWYLAYMPQILDSIALLQDDKEVQIPRPLFTANNEYKGGANLMQILVAMAVSDQAGRERIAKWVQWDATKHGKPSNELLALSAAIRPPKATTSGTLPTDAVVELLVLVGLGKTDPVAVANAPYHKTKTTGKGDKMKTEQVAVSPWLVEELRAAGWDRSDVDTLDDGDDTLSTSLVEYAKQLSGEKSRAAKSATRKAPKGKPKAAK